MKKHIGQRSWDQVLYQASQELHGFVVNPYQESLFLLSNFLNLNTTEIYLKKEVPKENEKKTYFKKIFMRKRGTPLEYLLKEKIFFEKSFYIESGVFIPRKDTEILIREVLKNVKDQKFKALDFGAGVGTLSLTLLSLFPKSQFFAFEISKKSIKCMKKNSQTFQVEKRLCIIESDVEVFTKKKLLQILGEQPSLIVSNPPYIDCKDQSLESSVYFYEPPLSFFSDQKGMGHIYSWFVKAMDFLKPGGLYIFEFGWNQLHLVKNFLDSQNLLESYKIYKDLSGHPRMALCLKSS